MPEIGATLREARMRSRIDISEVEVRTKIRAKYLRAMENEEWDMLPGPVYVKSFLRTYSDFLGLDSRMLIDEYRRRYERPSDQEPRPIATLGRERERDRTPRGPVLPPWAVVGLVLLAIVAVLFIVGNLTAGNNNTPSTGGAKARANGHRNHNTATTTTTTHTTPVIATPRTVTLHITPTSSVYICMANQSGKLVIPGATYSVGQTVPTVTAHKLLLTLGNSSVTMKAGFGPIHVAPSSVPTNMEISPTSARLISSAKAPNCG
ncbi:MAG TPA: helix-turn-helix domain-containing protein [Solirubrobacteraceae bacterium]|nr:helix-turn-helix domain-containing protein [Solirubrobacteraceae bacterium]